MNKGENIFGATLIVYWIAVVVNGFFLING